jgi:hypothetical protein
VVIVAETIANRTIILKTPATLAGLPYNFELRLSPHGFRQEDAYRFVDVVEKFTTK